MYSKKKGFRGYLLNRHFQIFLKQEVRKTYPDPEYMKWVKSS